MLLLSQYKSIRLSVPCLQVCINFVRRDSLFFFSLTTLSRLFHSFLVNRKLSLTEWRIPLSKRRILGLITRVTCKNIYLSGSELYDRELVAAACTALAKYANSGT